MAQLKFITPKPESIFIGMVVFTINNEAIPLQVTDITDDTGMLSYKLIDINSGEELTVNLSQLVVLSIEDNGKCFPIKYSRIGKALRLLNEKVQNINFKLTNIDMGFFVAKV